MDENQIFKFPRIAARISFNGEPPIEGEITKMELGGYVTQPVSYSLIAEIATDPVSLNALDEYQRKIAKEAQARVEAHERETLGFQSSCIPGATANGFAEFPLNLTFEHLIMTAGKLRPCCCGLTCNPAAYRWLMHGVENADAGMIARSNSGGTFLNGVELFEVSSQKETALAWYDEKAMREYLEANR